MADTLADKKKTLLSIIGREKSAAVACSGGVDSSLLLKLSCDVLGRENVRAVFADTPLLPEGEREMVREIAGRFDCRLHVLSLDPLSWPDFTANPRNRCYLCKRKIYLAMQAELSCTGLNAFLDGTNLDDLGEFRPGLKALEELGIKKPLAEARMTKQDIRRLSRELGLPNWNKHSSSCLATRIASKGQITREKIDLIQKCESFLQGGGFMGCRVRLYQDFAAIELLEEDIKNYTRAAERLSVVKMINDFGIDKVYLSMVGRQGIIS